MRMTDVSFITCGMLKAIKLNFKSNIKDIRLRTAVVGFFPLPYGGTDCRASALSSKLTLKL